MTWGGPQAALLPDGARLHLHHGPIDLIVWADEVARAAAYGRAINGLSDILETLVEELPLLRSPAPVTVRGPVARRMAAAVNPFAPVFITPMAAVAGAVADVVLAAMVGSSPVIPDHLSGPDCAASACLGRREAPAGGQAGAGRAKRAAGCDPDSIAPVFGRVPLKAWVNNGGDIALHLSPGQTFIAAMPGGQLTIRHTDPSRGIATSGWRGRSQSLGIADAVTVLAATGAEADAAATLIANAVDLPGHPAITRRPATEIKADSDLGSRLVTTAVGPLTARETARALDAGLAVAQDFVRRGLIHAAFLTLNAIHRATAPETVDA